jgi:hypothetical protein
MPSAWANRSTIWTRLTQDFARALVGLGRALARTAHVADLCWAFALHAVYKVLQAMTYTRGAYTVVYPVVRGTGPLVHRGRRRSVFQEHYGRCNGLGWPC